MQTWSEDVAGRGSSEVASCFWNFIQNCEEAKKRDHLVVWSDSCAGQNKNFLMICFYQFLIHKGIFKTIDHKYPEVGHTHLDSGYYTQKKNTLNEIVHFRDGVKWIRIEKFGTYLYKESYDPNTPFKEVSLLKNEKKRPQRIVPKDVGLTRIRNKTSNISEKKLENIKDQIIYVPEQDRWFYEQLFA